MNKLLGLGRDSYRTGVGDVANELVTKTPTGGVCSEGLGKLWFEDLCMRQLWIKNSSQRLSGYPSPQRFSDYPSPLRL